MSNGIIKKRTPEILLPALRQYRNNSWGDEFELLPAFHWDETCKIVSALEQQVTAMTEILQKVYLADDEGSSQFIEVQSKVSDCLFNNMGWTGENNNFVTWQERVIDER